MGRSRSASSQHFQMSHRKEVHLAHAPPSGLCVKETAADECVQTVPQPWCICSRCNISCVVPGLSRGAGEDSCFLVAAPGLWHHHTPTHSINTSLSRRTHTACMVEG